MIDNRMSTRMEILSSYIALVSQSARHRKRAIPSARKEVLISFQTESTYPDSWNITRYFPSELFNLAWTQ